MEDKLLLSPDEVASALGIGRSTCWKLLMSGDIPSIKIGKRRKVRREVLEQWLVDQDQVKQE